MLKSAVRQSVPIAQLMRDQGLRQSAVALRDIARGEVGVRFERDGVLHIAREGYLPLTVGRIIASADLQKLADVVTADDRVVLDAGAHSGLFSTLVKRRHPDVRVVAVEANPNLHPVIRANLAPYRNWDLVGKALSDGPGDATFYVNPHATQTSALSAESAEVFGGGEAPRPITVAMTSIDSLADELGIGAFDVVKLDIQGAEAAAIKGAERILPRVRKLIIEVTFLEERPEEMLLALREQFGDPTMIQPVMSGADLLYSRV
jgi:FkbM family methyltransferase